MPTSLNAIESSHVAELKSDETSNENGSEKKEREIKNQISRLFIHASVVLNFFHKIECRGGEGADGSSSSSSSI